METRDRTYEARTVVDASPKRASFYHPANICLVWQQLLEDRNVCKHCKHSCHVYLCVHESAFRDFRVDSKIMLNRKSVWLQECVYFHLREALPIFGPTTMWAGVCVCVCVKFREWESVLWDVSVVEQCVVVQPQALAQDFFSVWKWD